MTTTKNNEHKKLNVPNLRFPEFQGEWSITTLQKDFYITCITLALQRACD